jgi:tetratricopeptide (TPR) repeat protein
MPAKLSRSLTALAGLFLFSLAASAQTSSISGKVIGEDGTGLKDALIKIERKDIKGSYKVKTNKKGEYFHAGLPLGTYDVSLEVDGKEVDRMKNVRTRLGDPMDIPFDLQKAKQRRDSLAATAAAKSASGAPAKLTKEEARDMSPEERAAVEKQMKESEQAMAKNKALNDTFHTGLEALKTQQFDAAVAAFTRASEIDPKQHVIWANLAESLMGVAKTKTGDEQKAVMAKGLEAYAKALELKPDDSGYHNNYALALAKAGKFPEAQAELTKAAQMDPPNAGRYFYNLGALLVNSQQLEPAGEAFKKAIEADPNYADAHYQYGIYLISKAKTDAKGNVTPEPGTREAFEKYLELKADGPYAESAKGMLAMLGGQISTEYKNPAAAPKKGATTKKK